MAVEIIRCPACGEQARITYEENRVYQMSCVHCHNAMFHQDTSFDNAADFFKRVVILPCKVGEEVYRIVHKNVSTNRCGCKSVKSHDVIYRGVFHLDDCDNFGQTVFLTRPEAEAALAEKGGDT